MAAAVRSERKYGEQCQWLTRVALFDKKSLYFNNFQLQRFYNNVLLKAKTKRNNNENYHTTTIIMTTRIIHIHNPMQPKSKQ